MFLFGNKKKPESINLNEKEYIIPFSKNYKGYKRFVVNVYKNEEAEKNNLLYINRDLSNCEFKFVCFNTQYGRKMRILIDNLEVGTSSDEELIHIVENNTFEKVHAHKKDNDDRLTFFAKYKGE